MKRNIVQLLTLCLHLVIKHACSQSGEGIYDGQCGVPKVTVNNGLGRVVNGNDAMPGQWPWQASMYVKTIFQTDYYFYCGGVLIRPTWILTAAHCLVTQFRIQGILIGLGIHNQTNIYEDERQFHVVKQYFRHEEYSDSSPNYYADVTLLNLNTEVVYNDYVRPACLPTFGSVATAGQTCIISGFGDTKATGNQNILQYAGVDIISLETCNSWYADISVVVPNDHICAGFEEGGVDTCQGDSGGPLVCEESSVYVVRGITSYGVGCAQPRQPGAYTDVATYMGWILERIGVDDNSTENAFKSTTLSYSSTTSGVEKLSSSSSILLLFSIILLPIFDVFC